VVNSAREIETATYGQIEIDLDSSRHYGRNSIRTQSLLERPKRVLIIARLNEDESARINAELSQASSVERSEGQGSAGCNEQGVTGTHVQNRGDQRAHESQCGRSLAMRFCLQLVQEAAAEPATRKMLVKLCDTEWKERQCRRRLAALEACHDLAQGL
jgi:hypothetical protein